MNSEESLNHRLREEASWPKGIRPYGEYEVQQMQILFPKSTIDVLQEIEAIEFNWKLTNVPFPPSLGRRDANEPVRAWSVPRQTAWFLYSLVLTAAPRVTVEIGTSFGYSTLWIAAAAAKFDGVVHTVEMMPEKIEAAKSFLSRSDSRNVILHEVDANSFCRGFGGEINFLFLDADAASYTQYWGCLKMQMAPDSIVVADNAHTHPEQISEFIEEIKQSKEFESLVLPIDNGLLIARKKPV